MCIINKLLLTSCYSSINLRFREQTYGCIIVILVPFGTQFLSYVFTIDNYYLCNLLRWKQINGMKNENVSVDVSFVSEFLKNCVFCYF